ncbi:methionine ABC transporter ATP-binding protein [Sporosarcina pasteurii]|uniref:Methionine import ATP-binding protein MetN n=1 Tax=Sporosarcina pasteurii TaxID=1474 RepID=A0A380BUY8_SPOPA|nr:ATP-binding cassette domain-containing protein [Sporosarcina pasteurii]MDS9471269.1 ATP-binding cassette domain-containing protein [Sporosarcina pasteurii]QBQ05099.1 ATP-binding cassette domain-containing protein [Sporosarcina pasteurii]SUJ06552.1 Methionine import ATP-binding protein MetN [Sporosarcina pasteurii]
MIELIDVEKSFGDIKAVRPLSLTILKGEIHGIVGTSGAGKSTLIRMMNLLERPDKGTVRVGDQNLTSLTVHELRKARQRIGMIFQQFQLVLNRTVAENVEMPLELVGVKKTERKKRVKECLQFVGIADKHDAYPAELSGGQKQRVAIARALANHPAVLLCDEPTSSLDPETTLEVLQVLHHINQTLGVTIVIVTHGMDVIKSICERVSIMKNGQLIDSFAIQPEGIIQKEDQYIEDLRKLAVVKK